MGPNTYSQGIWKTRDMTGCLGIPLPPSLARNKNPFLFFESQAASSSGQILEEENE